MAAGEMHGWKELGEKVLHRAADLCPVNENPERKPGPHLKETLVVKHISGADPRILVGSVPLGHILGFVTQGTDPHDIVPVNASALRFTSKEGTVVFSQYVRHPGTAANNFIIKAATEVVSGQ